MRSKGYPSLQVGAQRGAWQNYEYLSIEHGLCTIDDNASRHSCSVVDFECFISPDGISDFRYRASCASYPAPNHSRLSYDGYMREDLT